MLEYSVCIIYLTTPNEEYIIIDIFIKLMAALPADQTYLFDGGGWRKMWSFPPWLKMRACVLQTRSAVSSK